MNIQYLPCASSLLCCCPDVNTNLIRMILLMCTALIDWRLAPDPEHAHLQSIGDFHVKFSFMTTKRNFIVSILYNEYEMKVVIKFCGLHQP